MNFGLRVMLGVFLFALAQFVAVFPFYVFIAEFDRQAAMYQSGIVFVVFILGVISASFWKYNRTLAVESMGEIDKAVYAAQIIQRLKDDHSVSGTTLLNQITNSRDGAEIAAKIKERATE